jgi:hypothetical protein
MNKLYTLFLKKCITLLSFSLLLLSQTFAQSAIETSVVIVACKSGTLIVDGTTVGPVEADDATKQSLSFGEHYLQLKTPTEKYNLTITVDQNTKDVIKLGCTTEKKVQGNRLIDKEVSLSGALGTDPENNVMGLDIDDEIILNCSVLNKKGNATIFLKEYNTDREIYRKERFTSLTDEKIKIPSKGVYYFTLYTDALFGKTAKLTIDRIPSKNSSPNFKTSVKRVYDTTSVEALNTVVRVYSATNFDHPNKTTISINLPKNTSYWTYWVGVGQEAQDKMKSFVSTLSQAGRLFSTNPLVLFGMKLIPALPMLNAPSTVNYRFTDTRNGQLFTNGQAYTYYTFKHADNITTDYSLIKGNFSDLVLALNNESTMTGQNVEIRVVAFVVTSKLVLEE